MANRCEVEVDGLTNQSLGQAVCYVAHGRRRMGTLFLLHLLVQPICTEVSVNGDIVNPQTTRATIDGMTITPLPQVGNGQFCNEILFNANDLEPTQHTLVVTAVTNGKTIHVTSPCLKGTGDTRLGFGDVIDEKTKIRSENFSLAPVSWNDETWEELKRDTSDSSFGIVFKNDSEFPTPVTLGTLDSKESFLPFWKIANIINLYLHAFTTNGYEAGGYRENLVKEVIKDRITPEKGIKVADLKPRSIWYITQTGIGKYKLRIKGITLPVVLLFDHKRSVTPPDIIVRTIVNNSRSRVRICMALVWYKAMRRVDSGLNMQTPIISDAQSHCLLRYAAHLHNISNIAKPGSPFSCKVWRACGGYDVGKGMCTSVQLGNPDEGDAGRECPHFYPIIIVTITGLQNRQKSELQFEGCSQDIGMFVWKARSIYATRSKRLNYVLRILKAGETMIKSPSQCMVMALPTSGAVRPYSRCWCVMFGVREDAQRGLPYCARE
ncbi:hypothetical protein BDQ17DRAFT_1336936 [Cyathus striatus]|nr:hypothetical protein BDQ17DRAFT_1336936 [Cyathus striatus]